MKLYAVGVPGSKHGEITDVEVIVVDTDTSTDLSSNAAYQYANAHPAPGRRLVVWSLGLHPTAYVQGEHRGMVHAAERETL